MVDELDAAAAPVHVHERSGSQSAYPGLLMGARIMHVDSGAQLSGAVYTFAALREAAVLDHVAAAMDAGLHPQNNLALAEWAIANAWLAQSCEPSASAAATTKSLVGGKPDDSRRLVIFLRQRLFRFTAHVQAGIAIALQPFHFALQFIAALFEQ